ncbi:hypothetical protein EIM50_22305 [Pseudoxanthomonas sp. SGD-10]|nr:hypothetical protein EIM50_22305 [Pseudoxanthomonas sp. SGD-10]
MIKGRFIKGMLVSLVSMLLMIISPINTLAQFEPLPGEHEPGGGEDPFADIPIDGGALALLAGGAALGYKALKKKKSEN